MLINKIEMKHKSSMFIYVNINLLHMKKKKQQVFSCTDIQTQGNTDDILIKPRNGLCDIDVTPAKFDEHVLQLYWSNNTCVTQNKLSEEDYYVQNEILDRKLTVFRGRMCNKSSKMY